MSTTKAAILLNHKTAAAWTSDNTILESGETGVESDTRRFKIGDGVTAWVDLTYAENVPAGTLRVWAGDGPGTIPAGWLKADGSTLLRSAYPALYAVIGDRYHTTANGTHFDLPAPTPIEEPTDSVMWIIKT